MTSIKKIGQIPCILGNIEKRIIYSYCSNIVNITGHCPLCKKAVLCDIYINKDQDDNILTGNYMSIIDDTCIYYNHMFIITLINTNTYVADYYYIDAYFNLVIPYISPLTSVIISHTKLLTWYERRLSNIYEEDIILYDIRKYLKNAASWDNINKAKICLLLSEILSLDVSIKIISYLDWLIDYDLI